MTGPEELRRACDGGKINNALTSSAAKLKHGSDGPKRTESERLLAARARSTWPSLPATPSLTDATERVTMVDRLILSCKDSVGRLAEAAISLILMS